MAGRATGAPRTIATLSARILAARLGALVCASRRAPSRLRSPTGFWPDEARMVGRHVAIVQAVDEEHRNLGFRRLPVVARLPPNSSRRNSERIESQHRPQAGIRSRRSKARCGMDDQNAHMPPRERWQMVIRLRPRKIAVPSAMPAEAVLLPSIRRSRTYIVGVPQFRSNPPSGECRQPLSNHKSKPNDRSPAGRMDSRM